MMIAVPKQEELSEVKPKEPPPSKSPHARVLAALIKAQAQMEAAKKDAINPHFGSHYSDLASVAAAIKEAFAKNGLGWRHKISSKQGSVSVRCVIFHESGEELVQEDALEIQLAKNTAQEVGSALTYGRRYTLQAEAGLISDDDDGNAATHAAPAQSAAPQAERIKQTIAKSSPPAERKTSPAAGVRVTFGTCKEMLVRDLPDKNLGWYLKTMQAERPKWAGKPWQTTNQECLDALEIEVHARETKEQF